MQLGGIGFVHYNMSVEEQVAAVKQAKTRLPWAAAQFATAPADAPVASLWPLQVGLHVDHPGVKASKCSTARQLALVASAQFQLLPLSHSLEHWQAVFWPTTQMLLLRPPC